MCGRRCATSAPCTSGWSPASSSTPQVDENARIVTFFNGAVARELLVDIDDDRRRLVYSVVESPLGTTHHNAAAQVVDDGADRSRFVWTTDLLPDTAAPRIREMMEMGAGVIKQTLESQAVNG